jgi:transposase InsO family protein
MQQSYHSNAKTNIHIRSEIKASASKNGVLTEQFRVSAPTICKWRNRTRLTDLSSRPHTIEYALSDMQKALIVSLRKATWASVDEIHEIVQQQQPNISRSSVYRTFVAEKINRIPVEKREEAKKFKDYEPGYLHIDVTYLPKFEGKSSYLYVAIDRCTRAMCYQVLPNKTAECTEIFMDTCLEFFPFTITKILTDNGLEFSNRLIVSKKGNLCEKPSKMDEKCAEKGIEHRLTAPATPKTNGMVERANGTIKNNTILKNKYSNEQEMKQDLAGFFSFYNLHRRHSSLKKELNVKTPFQAIELYYKIKPEIFNKTPQEFHQNIINLKEKITN